MHRPEFRTESGGGAMTEPNVVLEAVGRGERVVVDCVDLARRGGCVR
jgi:hypothetical protein